MTETQDQESRQKLSEEAQQIDTKVSALKNDLEELPTSSGLGYLQVKNHALLNYTKLELFYALLKLEAPEQVQDHPVFTELVRYRTLLERIRPLDRKMKYQVDKLLSLSFATNADAVDEAMNYGPNPSQLVTNDVEETPETNERFDPMKQAEKEGKYVPPKLASVPYDEDPEAKKEEKRRKKQMKRMERSTLLSEIRGEFSERPEEMSTSVDTALDKQLAKEDAEKKDYEESRFVRLVTSKKDKQRRKQREQEARSGADIGNIDSFVGVQEALGQGARKRKYTEKKNPVGGKTGGIFAHVDVPKESGKKRRVQTDRPNGVRETPAAGQKERGKSGKKKVVFSSLFD